MSKPLVIAVRVPSCWPFANHPSDQLSALHGIVPTKKRTHQDHSRRRDAGEGACARRNPPGRLRDAPAHDRRGALLLVVRRLAPAARRARAHALHHLLRRRAATCEIGVPAFCVAEASGRPHDDARLAPMPTCSARLRLCQKGLESDSKIQPLQQIADGVLILGSACLRRSLRRRRRNVRERHRAGASPEAPPPATTPRRPARHITAVHVLAASRLSSRHRSRSCWAHTRRRSRRPPAPEAYRLVPATSSRS